MDVEEVMQMNDVIHFYKTYDLEEVKQFYGDVLGLKLYKDQGKCLIYDLKGHGKIGFCTHHPKLMNESTCITFVYERKIEVEKMYQHVKSRASDVTEPTLNDEFKIYHFYAKDTDGHTLEFQVFLN